MTDRPVLMAGKAALFRLADLHPAPFSPRGASTNELINDGSGASMAAGVVHFRDCAIPFTLWYDEVMICHTVERGFQIELDGVVHSMVAGDMMWIPSGTSLVWRSDGTTTCHFVVSPPDWAKHKPQS